MTKLSVVVPVFNEEKTLAALLDQVCQVDLTMGGQPVEKELIVVNDCSTDQTETIVHEYQAAHPEIALHYFRLPQNQGKGAAVRKGIAQASGDYLIIQDGDLEYDPQDYRHIMERFHQKKAWVVYGSRNLKQKLQNPSRRWFGDRNENSYFSAYLGGVVVTRFFNLLTRYRITDEPTCYKAFRADFVKQIPFSHNDFAWEPELTMKIAKRGVAIEEVPISYYPRKIQEGKKINWRDGLKALYVLAYYWLFEKKQAHPANQKR